MLLPWALTLVAGLAVESSSACPSKEMLEQRLASLVERTSRVGEETRFAVARHGDELIVTRVGADGRALESRALPAREGTCEAVADDVAVVIATMLAEFQPAWTATLEPAPPPPPPVGVREVALAFGPALPLGDASRAWRLSAGVDVGRASRAWAASAAAFYEWGEAIDLGSGSAGVRRGGLALGLALRTRARPWVLAARAEMGAALTAVAGRGFSSDSTSFSADPVFAAGIDGGRTFGAWVVGAGALIELWPRPQEVRVTNVSATRDLPTAELLLRVVLGYRPRGH